ncbi:hypothetical protein ZIOFF_036971 [Zingiber officinale]|uniref:Uncharacterized protein n=1 Tax=Zingiber officinale TaxID=94328 RepID=A0A8J5GCM7_ZINOF|nr:hypothetical protein ZIOFF_036971 [Zingiber officinale]
MRAATAIAPMAHIRVHQKVERAVSVDLRRCISPLCPSLYSLGAVFSSPDFDLDLRGFKIPRPSHLAGHHQQNYLSQPHWKAQETSPAQCGGCHYQQRGAYPPPQSAHYPRPYGGYSQQSAPQGGFGSSGWDQRSSVPIHNAPTGAYNYYGHGGPISGMQTSIPNPMSGPSPMNYGRSQSSNYRHPAPYRQPGPTQQNYDQFYGQQIMGSQPNAYGQGSLHSGYNQQPLYKKPVYGAPQEGLPSYGVPARANQPGDPTYHGYAPSYGSGTQQYPYGYNAASQPAPAYNLTYRPAPGATDGYGQPPPSAYTQHRVQAAGQQAPAYSQPTSQVSAYTDPASGNTNYGYHGGPQAAYGDNIPVSGYATVPVASNASGYYDQMMTPQAG